MTNDLGLDAINISNVFHLKSAQNTIPAYFKNKATYVISCTYTKSIAYKIFNNKRVLDAFSLEKRMKDTRGTVKLINRK